MFYHIKGSVSVLDHNFAVLDVGGVGYAIHTTAVSQADLAIGKVAQLYIYNVIREDCFDLYGFSTIAEKRSFELLIGVSGVGPKAALSILSSSTPEQLALSIISEDEKALTLAPGVGKKLAQRVILELKDKMAKNVPMFAGNAPIGAKASGTSVSAPAFRAGEAAAALAVLGYTQSEIALALRDLDVDSLTLEETIRHALVKLGSAK